MLTPRWLVLLAVLFRSGILFILTLICLSTLWFSLTQFIAIFRYFHGGMWLEIFWNTLHLGGSLAVGWWILVRGWKKTYLIFKGQETLTKKSALVQILVPTFVFLLYAALVMPMLADFMRHGMEGSAKGNLNMLRHTLKDYQDEIKTAPSSLEELISTSNTAYDVVPLLWIHRPWGLPHPKSRETVVYPSRTVQDSGHWAYVYNPKNPQSGEIFIDCSHKDSRDQEWSSY